jgi:glyoxylase-like metal-dependent hydrolase (beta-lactamase superfamily II)
MPGSVFSFKIGSIQCLVVSDGTIIVPDMVTPKKYDPNDPNSGLPMDISCLVINTGSHQVLLDTGCGPAFGPSSGKLLTNLHAQGIETSDIDMVIISHAHGDHIGANTDPNGKLTFPKAKYAMHRREWEYWMGCLEADAGNPKSMLGLTRKNVPPLKSVLRLVEDREEILPGIQALLAPGHTPGGIMLMISSQGEKLCCIGDLVHHVMEMEKPELFDIFDVDKAEAVEARKRILPELARDRTRVFSSHFDFPGLGYVVVQGKKLAWQPSTS